MGHAAFGILAFPDGDGIVKSFPKQTIPGFFGVRRGHGEVLQRDDGAFPFGIEQGLAVRAVIYEKSFVLIPLTEVEPQDG